jgi:hypothetical protein
MTVEMLVERWLDYKAAMKVEPYDPDRVQALGMRFADAWHEMCKFDYSLKEVIMAAICTRVQIKHNPQV